MKSWNEHRFTCGDTEIHCHCSQPDHLRQVGDIQQTSLLLEVLLLAATRCHLHSLGEDQFLVAVSSVSGLIWADICATPNPCCGVQNSSSWSLGIRKLGATLRNPALPKVRATHSLWEGASHQCSRGWGGEEKGWDAFVMPLASFAKIRWPGWFWPRGEVLFYSASLSAWLGTIETGVDGMGQNENQSADVQGPR